MTIISSLLRAADLPYSPTARLDVELLLAAALGKSRSFLHTWPERIVSSEAAQVFADYLARRRDGEPVAYILGQQGFWKLDLEVAPDTLIPRPDTELLVETALELQAGGPARLLDLGTGTGAIALALASERPVWQVVAVDRIDAAVALAERNRQRLQLSNVEVRKSHWFDALAGERFAMILSNPPYIRAADPHLVAGDVRFEPRSALVAADHGLADLSHIITQSRQHLVSGGWLLLEHGWTQGEAVRAHFLQAGFERVETCRDYGGNERLTVGKLP